MEVLHMNKRLLIFASLVLTVFLLAACTAGNINNQNETGEQGETRGQNEPTPTETVKTGKIKVVAPSGATAISISKAMKDTTEINGTTVEYEIVPTTDLIVARLTSKEADFAVVPVNLAAQLYQKKVPYKLTSVVTWGNLFIASSEDIEGWDALKGQDIYLMGKGLVPDIVFRTLLKENGLDPDKDVNLTYLSGATELAPNFLNGNAKISMLPEPVLSTVKTKKPDTNVFLDLQEEWKKAFGLTKTGYPQAGIVVKEDLINNDPQLVKDYIKVLADGMDWINENPKEAGEIAEELELGLTADIVEKSMPGNNIRHEYVKDVKEDLDKLFEIMYGFNPETIGGSIPDDGLYYEID